MGQWFSILQDCPARVTVGQGSPEALRCTGLVQRTDRDALVIALVAPAPPAVGSSALIEVSHVDGLYRFTGATVATGQPRRFLHVSVPPLEQCERLQRRQHARVPVAVPAWIAVQEKQWQATVTNLSVGGLSLVTPAPLAVGLVLRLGFALGHGLPLGPIDGQVVRVSDGAGPPWAAGVMFRNLSDQDLSQLKHFVMRT